MVKDFLFLFFRIAGVSQKKSCRNLCFFFSFNKFNLVANRNPYQMKFIH